jgi:sugar phosphate isomerase/epimerase
MTTRRDFVQTLAASAAAVPALRTLGPLLPSSARHLSPLGVQLYTVRASMQQDVARTLARVREIGYREVEFAGYFGKSAKDLKSMLRHNGLSSPSAHVGLEDLTTKLEATLEAASEVGHRWLVLAWMDEKDRTIEGIGRIAGLLNLAGDRASRFGIRIAYHNHEFEFRPFPDGRTPLGELIKGLDPTHCDMELDLYWTVKGGSEPRTWFERFPGRFPLVHVKDAGPAPDFVMHDVGAGAMDWKRIFAERRLAGIQHYFIEHDEPADPWASIAASYRYLSTLSV